MFFILVCKSYGICKYGSVSWYGFDMILFFPTQGLWMSRARLSASTELFLSPPRATTARA